MLLIFKCLISSVAAIFPEIRKGVHRAGNGELTGIIEVLDFLVFYFRFQNRRLKQGVGQAVSVSFVRMIICGKIGYGIAFFKIEILPNISTRVIFNPFHHDFKIFFTKVFVVTQDREQ